MYHIHNCVTYTAIQRVIGICILLAGAGRRGLLNAKCCITSPFKHTYNIHYIYNNEYTDNNSKPEFCVELFMLLYAISMYNSCRTLFLSFLPLSYVVGV